MINLDSDTGVLLKLLIQFSLILFLYYPFSNLLKVIHHKKNKLKWDQWLKGNLSHEEYIQNHPNSDQKITCHFCMETRQGHQLQHAMPKSMGFGFIENKIDSKSTHYLSHYCSRCGSELFRSSHDV
jgi:hypothetical protein